MKKSDRTKFVCSSCGNESLQWFGKCPSCNEWNTLKEFKDQSSNIKTNGRSFIPKGMVDGIKMQKLSEVVFSVKNRVQSGIEELDRVLGGGFVAGEIVLLAGEPGVGKSTLILELGRGEDLRNKENQKDQKDKINIIYISGEESPEQIKNRAQRLGITGENMMIFPETQVEKIIEEVSEVAKVSKVSEATENKQKTFDTFDTSHSFGTLVIIDSVQTLWSEDIEGNAGSVSQVKGCTQRLVEFAKKTGTIIVLIGQINKDGEIAGPMMLSHMVDCVLFLEGERFTDLRLLRSLKNRFGPTDETGVFKMTEKGMAEVKNPSEIFLDPSSPAGSAGYEGASKIGAVTTCVLEGTRPVLIEIQALVTKSFSPMPRRVVSGLDYNRVLLLTAVLQKYLHLPLYEQDVFVKVGGGFKATEPAIDLAICLAIISSFKNLSITAKTVCFGEVGLLGEVKRVNGEEKRIKEAKKLGFSNILSASNIKNLLEGIKKAGIN